MKGPVFFCTKYLFFADVSSCATMGVMIRAFIGPDTQKARKAMQGALLGVQNGSGEALVLRFNDTSFDVQLAREALGAQNLFSAGNIVVFDGILDHPDGEEFYKTTLEKAQNSVLLRETEVNKELRALLGKIATVEEFAIAKNVQKPINNFIIADAIGARDKKAAWVEFEKIRLSGAAMEEVHGTIFWAFKSMYIVATASREEALATGMKDYTYRTYFNFSKHYLHGELKEKLGELKEMYHRAHRGEGELDLFIESFLIRL